MNKRIHELADEAARFSAVMTLPTGESENKLFVERFAELIIRKCAKVADLAQEHKCEWIGGNILTHFGVKE